MANVNKVMLVGRLTRDPEMRNFSGGRVANFGLAVNNRKKVNGEWVEEPCFLDCKAFDRDNGRKLAAAIENYTRKGSQVFLEGHLVLDQWEDKVSGGKRSKVVIIADDVQFLSPREEARKPAEAKATQSDSFDEDFPF